MADKVYDLAKIIDRERSKAAPIVISFGKDSVEIDPPVLWPDEVYDLADVDSARVLLGDKYEAFCEAGGTAALLFTVIIPEATGATMGESEASTD